MPVSDTILYLTESDVQQTLTVAEAVDLAEKGIQHLLAIQREVLEED